MKLDNYISFAIVNGFFLGLVLAILKFDAPEMIVIWTFFCHSGALSSCLALRFVFHALF